MNCTPTSSAVNASISVSGCFSRDMSHSIHYKVPAKINLQLRVGALREDGYHDIYTVLQAISLYDELSVSKAESLSMNITGECVELIPIDSTNIVLKAAQALAKKASLTPQVHFRLIKRIPVAAGLGGGSADAAAALVACNEYWGAGFSQEQLEAIGAGIGEDVPFLIRGMMAFGLGYRDPLIPIRSGGYKWHWVVGVLPVGLLTAPVFHKHDTLNPVPITPQAFREARDHCFSVEWGSSPPETLASLLLNDLEPAASALLPSISLALKVGQCAGALSVVMTGSGSTCLFLARDQSHADELAQDLRDSSTFRTVLTAVGPVPGAESCST